MPLAFSARAGSMLALTGTPVNIIVSDAAEDAGARQFGYFEFALAGVPLARRHAARRLCSGVGCCPTAADAYRRTSATTRYPREQYALAESKGPRRRGARGRPRWWSHRVRP